MKKQRLLKTIIHLSLFCLLLTNLNLLQAAQPLNRIVAIVNHDVITQLQLNRAVSENKRLFQATHRPLPSDAVIEKNTLTQLINEQLQLQFANTHDIQVTNKEVKRFVAQAAKNKHTTPKELMEQLKKSGYSTQAAQQRLRDQCLIVKIQQMAIQLKIHINDAEVKQIQQQYQQHQGPDTYQLGDLWITLPDDANPAQIEAAKQRAHSLRHEAIQKKQSLQVLAKTQGTGSGVHWHDLGTRSAADLPTLYNDALHQLNVNDISQPIVADNGIHLIQMMSKHTSQALSKEQAYNMLYQRQFNEDLGTWIAELRADAYVKVLGD